MFAMNDRITAKQMFYQMIMSMLGIFLVVLPGYGELHGYSGAVCCLGGFVLCAFYSFFLVRTSVYYGHLEQILGRFGKMIYSFVMILFFLFAGAYLVSFAYQIVSTYLAADAFAPLFHGIILLACMMAGVPEIQRRGRMAEVSFPILGILIAGLLLLSAGQQIWQEDTFWSYLSQDTSIEVPRVFLGSYALFAAAGGIWGLPFILSNIKGNRYRNMAGALASLFGIMAAVLFLLQGSYGTRQVMLRRWPIVSLMGGIRIPGGFIFRLDPIWIGLLLLLLFYSIGSTLFYANIILRGILPSADEKDAQEKLCGTLECHGLPEYTNGCIYKKTASVSWNWYLAPAAVYLISLMPTGNGWIIDYFDKLLLYVFCPVIVLFQAAVGIRGVIYREEKHSKKI